MDDSSQVLPLTGSPLRYIATVSLQKGGKCLKSMVSIYKKIRLPGSIDGPFEEVEKIWWFGLVIAPYYFMAAAFIHFVSKVGIFIILCCACGFFCNVVAACSILYWYRDKPFQLIGAKAKFMMEVIPMITAAALHHLLEFNYGYLCLVLGCSTFYYDWAHVVYKSYDIDIRDALLGIVMQVFAYMLDAELFVRVLALSFFIGLCFYRYMTYCAPEVPAHRKKELERLPC